MSLFLTFSGYGNTRCKATILTDPCSEGAALKVNHAIAISIAIVCSFLLASYPSSAASGSVSASPKLPLTAHTSDPSLNLGGAPFEQIMQIAREKGRVRVSVRLKFQMQAPHTLTPEAGASQADALKNLQRKVTMRVFGSPTTPETYHIGIIPLISMSVNTQQLRILIEVSNVESVTVDAPLYPLLNESPYIINANHVWKAGASGQGQVIAVIDTGIQKDHPMIQGRIVSEACYSTAEAGVYESLCWKGDPTSGGECDRKDCDHGTHVAGIAAGAYYDKLGSSGISNESRIISINVFSFDVENSAITMQWGDLYRALDHVYQLRDQYNVGAINLSLGDKQRWEGHCDDFFINQTDIIQRLREAGIITVIASGNEKYDGGINAPACISRAVSVGSANGLAVSNGTTTDLISEFSNHAKEVIFLAPGKDIKSASTAPELERLIIKSGTSMAAPHVAGAIALLRSARSSVTSEEAVHALRCTGKSIRKRIDGSKSILQDFETPRIDVLSAYMFLVGKAKFTTYLGFAQDYDLQKFSFFRGRWARGDGTLKSTISGYGGWDRNVAIHTTCIPRDVTIELRFREKRSPKSVSLYSDVGIIYRGAIYLTNAEDPGSTKTDGYQFLYREGNLRGDDVNIGAVWIFAHGRELSECTLEFETPESIFHTLRIEVRGPNHSIYFRGDLLCEFTDDYYPAGNLILTGYAGYSYSSPFSVEVEYDYINVLDRRGSTGQSSGAANSQRPPLVRKSRVSNWEQQQRSTYVARRRPDVGSVRGGTILHPRGGGNAPHHSLSQPDHELRKLDGKTLKRQDERIGVFDIELLDLAARPAWPSEYLGQIRLVRTLLAKAPTPTSPEELASVFDGKNTVGRRKRIEEVLETLVVTGVARTSDTTGQRRYFLPRLLKNGRR